MKKFFDVLKKSFREWQEDKASRLAAALSYYTIFSLAPMLVIVIGIAGLAFGQAAAEGAIVEQIGSLVGQQGAQQIQTMIQNASLSGRGLLATIIGVITLLLGATGVFGQLQDAMNTIWEVKPKPGRGFLVVIKDRFLSFSMVLGIAFLLLVSLVVTAGLSAFGNRVLSLMPGTQFLIQVVNFLLSFAVITFLFVLFFKYLPDAKIAWKDVWLGAAVTSLLFSLGRTAIGIYLGNSNVTGAFGAAGSLIILFIWVYYSGQILFFGAEFTQVYANTYGSGVQPAENAVRVTEEDRAHQGLTRHEETTPKTAVPAPVNAPQKPVPASAHAPQESIPARAYMPVTGQHSDRLERTEAQREQPGRVIVQEALPMLVALAVGLVGSLAIAREQRKRPLVKSK